MGVWQTAGVLTSIFGGLFTATRLGDLVINPSAANKVQGLAADILGDEDLLAKSLRITQRVSPQFEGLVQVQISKTVSIPPTPAAMVTGSPVLSVITPQSPAEVLKAAILKSAADIAKMAKTWHSPGKMPPIPPVNRAAATKIIEAELKQIFGEEWWDKYFQWSPFTTPGPLLRPGETRSAITGKPTKCFTKWQGWRTPFKLGKTLRPAPEREASTRRGPGSDFRHFDTKFVKNGCLTDAAGPLVFVGVGPDPYLNFRGWQTSNNVPKAWGGTMQPGVTIQGSFGGSLLDVFEILLYEAIFLGAAAEGEWVAAGAALLALLSTDGGPMSGDDFAGQEENLQKVWTEMNTAREAGSVTAYIDQKEAQARALAARKVREAKAYAARKKAEAEAWAKKKAAEAAKEAKDLPL